MTNSDPWVRAAPRASDPHAPTDPAASTVPPATPPLSLFPPSAPQSLFPPPVTGAAAPQASVTAPGPGQGALPLRMVRPTASLWVVGAHGGAGETSIAALHPTWEATGHTWPTPSELTARCPSILVARTHAAGLHAAQKTLTQWASGVVGRNTPLLGLVLVADAPGRIPKPLRELAAHVSGGAPRTWHVSWMEAWRMGEDPAESAPLKALRHLVADLTTLTGSPETE